MSEAKSKAAQEKVRRQDGKFVKGVSGNPKGRPKKPKTGDLPKGFHEAVGTDPIKGYEELMKITTTAYEFKKLCDALAPFKAAKLSSQEVFSNTVQEIKISFLSDDEPILINHEPIAEEAEVTESVEHAATESAELIEDTTMPEAGEEVWHFEDKITEVTEDE